ncbi:MAG TPA: phosphoribosylformylglycinamidine synthase subunit PurL [Ktedonobacteraceae bacterium]|nr:phosphoribosylformylglycinamidine synthase subunit PurL [Ktedonobacteraceae bacterium]
MNFYFIEVRAVSSQHDIQARKLAREMGHLPTYHLPSLSVIAASQSPLILRTAQLYQITGTLNSSQIDQLTRQLLVDPVIQEARIFRAVSAADMAHVVDVFFHPGVTDTLAESVITGAQLLGINGIEHVETGRRFLLDSRLHISEVRLIAEALLYNPVIQQYTLQSAEAQQNTLDMAPTLEIQEEMQAHPQSHVVHIPLTRMSNEALLELSKSGMLALNLDEMCTIQAHFRSLGREPTDVEMETLAQTWSEHCSHKTFRARITYRELDGAGNILAEETIENLLRQYIMRATHEIARPWVVSAFSDNAGVIKFTETQDIAFKVETHNHPSAIEPFGGANTGVGGVIRDILGVSALPIACTDVLCFGPPDTATETLPAGILAPRRVADGVVNGVRDYGNKMGIPTVNGAVLYHPGYIYNPLVFCGCLGLLPHGSHPREAQPGDHVVVLGGRTGRDGIHGATFSSGEMSSEINAQAGAAVQIGAPITEKKVTDAIIQARDLGLYHAITDCGAGGFSSAVGEMGAEIGVQVELAKAPLKYQGLAPWEIWLSEAQERMVLAVPPSKLNALLEICAIEEVETSIIGTFTGDKRLKVTYHGEPVADLDMAFLHEGRPDRAMDATWQPPSTAAITAYLAQMTRADALSEISATPVEPDAANALLSLLSHPTIASKEEIVRCYDHEVQGSTVLKPLVGSAGNGPGDAAVLQPILTAPDAAGIVISNGINPLYGLIDPYHMATCAVDEALRNLTAVGGDIEHAAILDNFCWGNPADPAQLGSLVRAVKGCYAAAVAFGTPFVSGKDSLNNEYRARDQRLPVIPTLLISAFGTIEDAACTVDMSLKAPGNLLYQVGATRNELAGSHYAMLLNDLTLEARFQHTEVPHVHFKQARTTMRALGAAIRAGLTRSCHDLSEGGLAVAAAEMALAGKPGLMLNLAGVPHHLQIDDHLATILLFSETASRFLVEVVPEQQTAFEHFLRQSQVSDFACIGRVTQDQRLVIQQGEPVLVDLPVSTLQAAWKGAQA